MLSNTMLRHCRSSYSSSGKCVRAAPLPSRPLLSPHHLRWQPHNIKRPSAANNNADSSSSSSTNAPQRPIDASRALAAARAAEAARGGDGGAVFADPYSALLAEGFGDGSAADATPTPDAILDIVATAHLDACLMNAVDQVNVNGIKGGEFRQVVLLGDGRDTRPYRLPWPPGTAVFLVAPPEVHERAEALLAAAAGGPPRMQRGCLLRRVSLNLNAAAAAAAAPDVAPGAAAAAAAAAVASTVGFDAEPAADAADAGAAADSVAAAAAAASRLPAPPPLDSDGDGDGGGWGGDSSSPPPQPLPTALLSQLERAGFRPDRLSVWALQGLHSLGLPRAQLLELLAEVANGAAYRSLVVGELPSEAEQAGGGGTGGGGTATSSGTAGKQDVENMLAEVGLLGAAYAHGDDAVCGALPARLRPAPPPSQQQQHQAQQPQRWLFAAQQMRLSWAQMDSYEAHVAAAEAADEDFFGNFS